MVRSHFSLAFEQARIRRGLTAPNPPVGAVVARGTEVLGVGHHWGAGHPHAEVNALEQAGERARGAELYVTLEPCSHFGRTPPCTGLIREKGITQVYYGFRDPNPEAAGGERLLKEAGIACERVEVSEITELYRPFAHWQRTGLPWTTGKVALNPDGRLASEHVTGPQADELTHRSRKEADAILTGIGTVLADDPGLDARFAAETFPKPVFVADRLARTPLAAKLFSTASPLTILHGPDAPAERLEALRAKGARTVAVTNLEGMLKAVGSFGAHSLWVEAGSTLFGALLGAKLLNRVVFYVAGAAGTRWSRAGKDAVGVWEP